MARFGVQFLEVAFQSQLHAEIKDPCHHAFKMSDFQIGEAVRSSNEASVTEVECAVVAL